METVGEIIATLRAERNWTQEILAQKTGFTRGYVGNVEYTGRASVPFLAACERAFSLESGSLVKWPIYSTVKRFCRKYKLTIQDFRRLLEAADNSFRHVSTGGPPSAHFGSLRGAEVAGNETKNGPPPETRHYRGMRRKIM